MEQGAVKLRDAILEHAPGVWDMLSGYGREIYFIEDGVLGQTAEAREKANWFNATLGEAAMKGKPLYFPGMHRRMEEFSPEELYPYASPYGEPKLRKLWREKTLSECPDLAPEHCSLPVVTNGLTHGLSLVAELFVDPGDAVLLPGMHWENYATIYGLKQKGNLMRYPLFDDRGAFSTKGLAETLKRVEGNKALVVLNAPSNPCGYMPTEKEAGEIRDILVGAADGGKKLTVLVDDAYFGFFYAEECRRQSLFALLAGYHSNILPLRLNGATKEFFAGGLRVGFLTVGASNSAANDAVVRKLAGAVRCGVSSCSRPSQRMLLDALESDEYEAEKSRIMDMIVEKGKLMGELAGAYPDMWRPYPFNAGYFVCLHLHKVNAYQLRQHLLEQYGVGVIVLSEGDIRISFTSLDVEHLKELTDTIYEAAKELQQ